MKVKYLGTLFAASVLSLGLVTSCATPDAGETELDPDAGVVDPVDPGVVDPVDPGVVDPVDPGVVDPVDPGVIDPVDPGVEEVDPETEQ